VVIFTFIYRGNFNDKYDGIHVLALKILLITHILIIHSWEKNRPNAWITKNNILFLRYICRTIYYESWKKKLLSKFLNMIKLLLFVLSDPTNTLIVLAWFLNWFPGKFNVNWQKLMVEKDKDDFNWVMVSLKVYDRYGESLVGSYHLKKIKKKIKVSILERQNKEVRKHANLTAIHSLNWS